MKLSTLLRATGQAAGLAAGLAACGGGDGGTTTPFTPTTQDVSIQFSAVAGSANTPVACGTLINGLGSTPTSAQLTDLRFYVTDVQLVNDKGVAVPVTLAANAWQQTAGTNTVTLIDLENGQGACGSEGTAATNAVVRGTVPGGNYVKVKATLGVPEAMSHSDVMAAAAPLDIMAMGWSWQAGRKFAKIEINPVGGVSSAGASVATYNVHLASTDCTGRNDGTDTCTKKNLSQFTLDFNAGTQQIAIDLAALFAGTDVRNNQSDAVGCMSATSDLDCAAIFTRFGLDLSTGGQAGTAQSVFRAIAK
jgi:uncharacterized repeat protein (TIGR04052 family)